MCDCVDKLKAITGDSLKTAVLHYKDGRKREVFRVECEGKNVLPTYCPFCAELVCEEIKEQNDKVIHDRPSGTRIRHGRHLRYG